MLPEPAGLLFRNFRSGWDVAVYQVKEDTTYTAVLQPLLVVATKTVSVEVSPVKSFLEVTNPTAANAEQVRILCLSHTLKIEEVIPRFCFA